MNAARGEEGRLIVRRAAGYIDRIRAYRIIVDGRDVGRLRMRSSLEIPLSAGEHWLEARLDWCRSPVMSFTLPPGGRVEVEAGNRYGLVLSFLPMLFRWWRYLKLVQVG